MVANRGFTLVETLIALVLSSFVIVLVSHAFLVQNRFYSTQTQRTAAQDNVRASTELIAREVRTAMEEGIVVAGARTLTVRSPIAVTVVCARSGSAKDVFLDGGEGALDTDEVGGVAHRDPATRDWIPVNTTWAAIDGSGNAAANCAANGADTVGGSGSFHRLAGLNPLFGPPPGEGDVVMLFRETTFKIQPSILDPSTLGIFRAAYGESLVEFATGVDTTAQFQYRTVGGGYADTVSAASLASVDAVRLVADARKPAPTGGVEDITFGWSVNVPLRLAR
ncbi:MAG: prepilin-type N-terminal cleavage/methylation domain-containing protein [Gemmatimonadetes bacterium]|nr:prepilin-type N-terminal cleavage/methylation domain-containing protein [Gemmatimonadota bacterium]NNF13973.1 prepilin-type N-terminal cleavage/methylation domain-containing protein [Gemmatimonadota bacterium]NNL30251.1 prepilin-type N-terminal cleavage/methylation domain-containing protein [Gemmatimonadota bacterium]